MHDEYYFVNQDGVKSSDFHILFERYPSIKMGKEQFEKKTVPGRGNVYYRTGTYADTEISMLLDVNAVGHAEGWMAAYTEARRFLTECQTISFCDKQNYFYKVKCMEISTVDQYTEEAGDFDAYFYCEAGAYLKDGIYEYDPEEVLMNSFSECHPVYKITGEGVCTLTVNGKSMSADVGQNLTIDTNLMIAYRTDGAIQNTAVTGDYSDLYLQHGENSISITSGFELKIIPNWRCL